MIQLSTSTNTPTYLVSDYAGVGIVYSNTYSAQLLQTYSPYGAVSIYGNTNATPFSFQGGYKLPGNLIYFIHRVYDPSTGGFISVDPMFDTTYQAYAFANGDPMNGSDPSGMYTQGFCVNASGALGISGTVELCIAETQSGQAGIVLNPSFGGGLSFKIPLPGSFASGISYTFVIKTHGILSNMIDLHIATVDTQNFKLVPTAFVNGKPNSWRIATSNITSLFDNSKSLLESIF